MMGRRNRSMAKPPATSATVYGNFSCFVTIAIADAAISSHKRNSIMEAVDILSLS